MSHDTPDMNPAAEQGPDDTKRFVLQVRPATRKKYTSEEKVRLILKGFRRERVKPYNFNSWTKGLMEDAQETVSFDQSVSAVGMGHKGRVPG